MQKECDIIKKITILITGKVNDNMKLRYEAKIDNLPRLMSACGDFLLSEFPSHSSFNLLNVAIEEVFVNIASYAYENETGYIDFEILRIAENGIRVIFTDFGKQFNPVEFDSESNARNNIENLQLGGLGIALVKRTMKNLRYQYVNKSNVFSFEALVEEEK